MIVLFSNLKRSASTSIVNSIIKRAKKAEQTGNLEAAISLYKEGLANVFGIDSSTNWTIYEMKENISTNGWFILNKLNILYPKLDKPFDLNKWSELIGQFHKANRLYSDDKNLRLQLNNLYKSL